ncbi:antitoxin [Candidatus Bathyarchaeota archaeon CG_4_8_14_3_um_filter_42_8]|nr:MAG: antitoxin [Candidatus Bathyarchaeota archaeon CG_4_8_14_3_um_filter_42_8]
MTVNPKILAGKPIIKGTRISVEVILDLLANGWTTEQILENYPQLKREDITAVLKYATEILKEERVYSLP